MKGHLHPVTIVNDKIVRFFEQYGFEVLTGPEIETEEYNFDKLNIPADHPARDIHDTFYLEDGRVLRTHTSPMQIRAMEDRQPPVRLLILGRTYRQEATDATHETTFSQIEGLVIDENINLENLLGMLEEMVKAILPFETKVNFRPSYFPFVEPGLEIDIKKDDKWLEVLGEGMVHPKVLQNMNVDPTKFQGFAFGLGLERFISLIYNVSDIRLNLSGDYRYLGQFNENIH